MKYTLIIALLLNCCSLSLIAQTDQENLEKYWAYRDRLIKNFVHSGNNFGNSIPISARRIGFPSGSIEMFEETASSFYWQDGTIYLGHYMQVLATEYRLLMDAGQDTEQTLNEIYYCLATLNRLDIEAEYYLSQHQNNPGPEDLNGFFLRDDVSQLVGEELYDLSTEDYSDIFNRGCNFQTMHADNFMFNDWNVNETDDYNHRNVMSLDQIIGILTGLLFIDIH